jgi:hypothetical protein
MTEKQIYFYWGNASMSFLRYMTIKSFSHFNPDWQIFLIENKIINNSAWVTPEIQDSQYYNGYDYRQKFADIKNLTIIEVEDIVPFDHKNMADVHIKDMLNWYLLSTKTCIVADMDIIFCRAIDDCKAIDWDANVNICNYDFYHNYMPVSFMISKLDDKQKNNFYDEVYTSSKNRYNPSIYESCGTNSIPYRSIYEIINKFKDLKINKLSENVVFPFLQENIGNVSASVGYVFEKNYLPTLHPDAAGIHWYGGDTSNQKYNNSINEQNYMDYDNTMCNIIKTIIN